MILEVNMKKFFLISLLVLQSVCNYAAYRREESKRRGDGRTPGELIDSLRDEESGWRAAYQARMAQDQVDLAVLSSEIDAEEDPVARRRLIEDRADSRKQKHEIDLQLHKNGEHHWAQVRAATEAHTKIALEREQAGNLLERTRVRAAEQRQASIESSRIVIQEKLNFIRNNPKLLIALAAGTFAAYHISKEGSNILFKIVHDWYKLPTLAQETSLLTYGDRVKRYFFPVREKEQRITDVILDSKLTTFFLGLTKSIKNTINNGTFFRHVLLWGPPGGGKTMMAKRIAKNSGLEYIYFAASSLDQFSIEEGMIKLTELFKYAEKSPVKLMIIIDEAEMLFANREKELSEKARKMLNLILGYTGTETNNFIIFALTNRPQDLDSAFLNRCGEIVEIGLPGLEQRKQIIRKYINDYLIELTKLKPQQLGFFESWFKKAQVQKKISISAGTFSDEVIDEMAKRMEGFAGRDISLFVLALQAAVYNAPDLLLTEEMVREILEQKITQKQAALSGFAKDTKK